MTLLGPNMTKLAYKTSKVRDIGDEMAQNLLDFAQKDSLDNLFTNNMKQFAYCLSAVEDNRDSTVRTYQLKLLNINIKKLKNKKRLNSLTLSS